ncbi:hypothetical protein C882_3211 [Caenispirillum salinarum AK4]|uniref:Uncharacterized protein n=1 Tax=Caenispirillum salinarum AK4 TaxID=1238182 RepID=K9H3P1_9PROT|nr:tetratricopeptide repeat-containing sulfotransferase family protein [Caenispirillum salinarum]EKV32147.1 hypothetical protein C882_3211 [Caenispirillum salinarum AK4]
MPQNTAAPVANVVRQAQQQHMRGNIRQAEQLYRQVLASDPRNPEAIAGLGLVAAQAGNLPAARELLKKALSLQPENPDNLVNLAKVDIGLNQPAEAERALLDALKRRKRDAAAWNMLGWCQQRQGRLTEAVDSFRQAVRIKGDLPEALNNLGTALMLLGDNAEAAKILARCVSLAPKAAQAHMNLGSVYAALDKEADAIKHGKRATELAPQAAEAWFNLGRSYHTFDHADQAIAAYGKAVELAPQAAQFMNNLAQVLESALRSDEALAWAEKAAAMAPDVSEWSENLVRGYLVRGRLDDAKATAEAFLARHPDTLGMRLLLGDLAIREGRFEDAKAAFSALLEEDGSRARALRGLARADKVKAGDPLLDRMADVAAREDIPVEDRVELYFALGKANDDVGDVDTAFHFYAQGNALKNRGCRYDPAKMEDHIDGLIETFTADFLAERADWGDPSERPTFIVGLPRSGTTLVEQILSSHPQVAGGDELPDFNQIERLLKRRVGYPRGMATAPRAAVTDFAPGYLAHLERIDPDAVRVTDKLPGNALRLGLIALMFPQARVVHCRRDPVDTSLSIYFQNFGGAHEYGYDLASIGHFHRQVDRLMAHWKSVVPTPVLDVDYEAVVADHEGQGRRMIQHLGLDWDDAMAAFYANKRVVNTASVWQVRQPIYKGSVERWRKYEAHIGPLLDALGMTR